MFWKRLWSLLRFGWDRFGDLQNIWSVIGLFGMSALSIVAGFWGYVRGLSLFTDILIVLVVFALGSFFLICIIAYRETRREKSSLEIIFDPTNPGHRFWSLKYGTTSDGPNSPNIPYWEYRVAVHNTSDEVAKNVHLTVQHDGPIFSALPRYAKFEIAESDSMDIQPGYLAYVPIMKWWQNKKQPGLLAGESAWAYGPVRVIASADNMQPAIKIFEFNYETEQMFFEERPTSCQKDNFLA